MRVFAVSGFSFSGKTFLLEQIVKQLVSEGISVATVKSTKEDIRAPEGTDTWRHGVAGANPTILSGPNTTTIRFNDRVDILKVADTLNVDYLLLEGFKGLDVPKFWCIGETSEEISEIPNTIRAIIIWEGSKIASSLDDIPIISNAEIDKLTSIVKTEAIDVHDVLV
ncbi:MAG: molybdopterin-guanine dinucleotide biosynthesis protein B [Candidatus Thorarchaeota archaeon]|nr:molybdopterin-guanine dinucleotide biosynthesis protein B [Candidatus Thorarchaeota archaeon]